MLNYDYYKFYVFEDFDKKIGEIRIPTNRKVIDFFTNITHEL